MSFDFARGRCALFINRGDREGVYFVWYAGLIMWELHFFNIAFNYGAYLKDFKKAHPRLLSLFKRKGPTK